jgi:hypothetical protein
MKPKIGIVIPYFGPWPAWIEFFVESCRWNRGVDWFLFSDNDPPENRSRNVRHVRLSFEDYKSLVSDALGLRFNPREPYKLCDVRPALPFIHRDLLAAYDFVGTGDVDVIYGDLRSFYDDQVLSSYDLLSSHSTRISGHLSLMRNDDRMITAFRGIRRWTKTLEQERYVGLDESGFYDLFRGRRAKVGTWLGRSQPRCFLREAYSTPAVTDRMRWYWKDGRVTNEYYPDHPFMYLHFMNWHSNRWYAYHPHVEPGATAPWKRLAKLVQMDWRDARQDGFMISPAGIQRLPEQVSL